MLPDVDIAVEEVTLGEYEDKIGLKAHVRRDDTLYADFETEKERTKRLAQEAKRAMQEASAAEAASGKGKKGAKSGASDGRRDTKKSFFRITARTTARGWRTTTSRTCSGACCRVPSTV